MKALISVIINTLFYLQLRAMASSHLSNKRHADNLELDTVNFKTLVNGRRWQKRGFIDV